METPKRKRQHYSIETKQAIINASTGKTHQQLADQFKIPAKSMQTILQSKQKILEAIENGASGKRARLTTARNDGLDEALLKMLVKDSYCCVNILKKMVWTQVIFQLLIALKKR